MIHSSVKIGEFVFIDPSASIGENSVIWHHCRILANVVIGKNVSVGGGTEIGRGSIVGDNTRISTQCFLPSNSVVGERVFLAPQVCATDDMHPRSGNVSYEAKPPRFGNGCSIGAQSVIRPGVKVGKGAMVGCGSVITRDVPDGAIVRGEPARVRSMENFDIYADPMRTNLMETHLLPT